ncbi:MAG: hypothetical protein CUN56_01305 [Phototrophicales bacterium]|nr:MAG: hypothetical protein CUN56_01305 [Phototrophicales bacterium]RMG75205.1 MAG: class I SAM-dependent methyltransferase [Chloroflexota bacterium]
MTSFDRAVEFYDETRGFPPGVENQIAKTIQQVGHLTKNSLIAEIGIGTGRIALPLAHLVKAIHGVDLSSGMLHKLRQKQHNEPVYVVQGAAEHLPYPAQTFDAVIVVHVFHLVQDLDRVQQALRRVLKPQGILIHCWNTNDPTFGELRRIGYEAAHGKPQDQSQWEKARKFHQIYNWQETQRQTFTYYKQQSPADFVAKFKERIWSNTWSWTDEQISCGVMAMQAVINKQYDDPTQPITEAHELYAVAFRPK